MSFWHNIIDKRLEEQFRQHNCFPKEMSVYLEPSRTPDPECDELELQLEKEFAELNIYDLYRKCWHAPSRDQLYALNSKGEQYKVGATA